MRPRLLVSLFSCVLLSYSCQKSSSNSAPQPDAVAMDVNSNSQGTSSQPAPNPDPKPLPIPTVQPSPGLPEDSGQPAQQEPPPTEGVTALSIQAEGAFIIGHKKKLRAIAFYAATGTAREVPAQWTMISNEAEATLDADGGITAAKEGRVVVSAAFANKVGQAQMTFEEPMLKHKEDQFWVYRLNREFLVFNNPWDKEPGNAIFRSPERAPDFARSCLDQAKEQFSVLQKTEEIRDRIGALIASGVTSQMIFMVNAVPVDGRRNDLRRLDRDAYFWHWTREDIRPSLAMSKFKEGVWVWEVIASPGECLQPEGKEIIRFLDYVASRVAGVQ